MAIEIRPIRAGEYEEAGRLIVEAYRSIEGAHDSSDYDAELLAVERRSEHAAVLVAVDDDGGERRVLGCVTLVDDPDSPYAEELEPGELGIRMLGVLPSEQGRGVGSQLLQYCVDEARRAGKTAVFLHTTPWMTAAHRLYERSCFERQPERDWAPLPEVPLLAYRLSLHTDSGAA